MIHEVLERCEELNNLSLDNASATVLCDEKDDQVFVHAHVIGVDHAIDLWRVVDPVIVDFVDQLLEVLPGWQFHLELLFARGASQARRDGGCRRFVVWAGSRCLNRVLDEDQDHGWCGPDSFAFGQNLLITLRFKLCLRLVLESLDRDLHQLIESHVQLTNLGIVHSH